MACFHPIRAWRTVSGAVVLAREQADAKPLHLPCSGCLGCRMDKAREWALRCHLELQEHRTAAFITLTYDEKNRPQWNSLWKPDLQLWLKRFRKSVGPTRPIRFFASGEYGETGGRPHYHAILYGSSERDAERVHETWGKGITKTLPVTPAAVAYVAGYTAKKVGWKLERRQEVDPETGELLDYWEPPFIQMSRRPGIGGDARIYTNSWRSYAVHNGRRIPVPRYLHNAWKEKAEPNELEELEWEKEERAKLRDTSKERREAAELIAIARQRLATQKRKF